MILVFPTISIWDGGESRTAMLSYKASLKEIQLLLGRGQLQYFTFELTPALRSCLICGHREFGVVGKANRGTSKGAYMIPILCQSIRMMSGHADQLQF